MPLIKNPIPDHLGSYQCPEDIEEIEAFFDGFATELKYALMHQFVMRQRVPPIALLNGMPPIEAYSLAFFSQRLESLIKSNMTLLEAVFDMVLDGNVFMLGDYSLDYEPSKYMDMEITQ